jgi:PPOX class probable F420-dependent enzyme
MGAVDVEAALRFVAENHHAILATRRRDGSPQLSPIVAGVDDQGRVVVSTRETAIKVKNARRDARVAVCAFGDSFFGPWAQIDGTAEVVSLPDAMDGLVAYYRSISGEHPDWDDYRDAMQREKRVLLLITPERVGPNISG